MATIEYEPNGNGLQSYSPVATGETASEFYGYDGAAATHAYQEYNYVTLFVHVNTDDDTHHVVCTAGENGAGSGKHGVEVDFSETIDPSTDYLVKDDPPENTSVDDFNKTNAGLYYNGSATDGFVIDASTFRDVTFTLRNSELDEYDSSGISGFRVVTNGGSNVDYLGFDGSARFTFEGLQSSPVSTGDLVVMVRDDLAIHGKT